MKCLLFKKELIEALLELSAGEVQRWSDKIETLSDKDNGIVFEKLKSKYEGRVMTFNEMLKFGKEIEYDYDQSN
jgi:hypothetical protein